MIITIEARIDDYREHKVHSREIPIRCSAYHLSQTAGFAIEVDILENDRKKRDDASQERWHPARGEIRIRFVGPVQPPQNEGVETVSFAPIHIKIEPLYANVLRDRH